VRVLTTRGLRFVSGLSKRDASAVGQHWNAVRRYLETGEDHDLDELDRVQVGDGLRLETRTRRIETLAIRGEVSFESIYGEVS
jgi:hypothetical protein